MTLKIFGYPGCTTVKRARVWADETHGEHDYAHFSKVDDLAASIDDWVSKAGIDAVFNDRAQTFKKMQPSEQAAIVASDDAKKVAMAADPRLIKRPVGTDGATVLTGFKDEEWTNAFS
ncbi:MAG: ArsC/Spx/MgsR family protein [Ahrensia sp.]